MASSHRFSTCSRVASGFSRVWSITPATLCQLARVWEVNAAESNVPWSKSRSSCMGEIAAMVMLLYLHAPLSGGGVCGVLRGMSIVLGDELTKSTAPKPARPDHVSSDDVFFAATLFDVHPRDQGIANFVHMVNNLVRQQLSLAIMNYLVNFYHPSAALIGSY